jgi:hypothetical protein
MGLVAGWKNGRMREWTAATLYLVRAEEVRFLCVRCCCVRLGRLVIAGPGWWWLGRVEGSTETSDGLSVLLCPVLSSVFIFLLRNVACSEVVHRSTNPWWWER